METVNRPCVALRNLAKLNYAQHFTLWHYRSHEDTLAVVTSPGYFNDAAGMLADCDMILMTAIDGSCMVVVRNPVGGNVTVESLR